MFQPTTRILIVDDMGMMRKAIVKFCTEMGYTDLTEAQDGVDAWTQISKASPPFGLIISDWNMPNCSGLDLLKRLRADSTLGKTPMILCTAEKEKEQVVEAVKAGVSGYVIKPF